MPSKACCQTTRVIQSTDDLEGFEAIRSEETWEIWKSEAGEDGVTLVFHMISVQLKDLKGSS